MSRRLMNNVFGVLTFLFVLLLIGLNEQSAKKTIEDPIQTDSLEINKSLSTLQNSRYILHNNQTDLLSVKWKVLLDGTVIPHENKITDLYFAFKINNPNLCADLANGNESFVIVVISNIVHFEQRQAIRETWGLRVMQQMANYRVAFLVGLNQSSDVQSKLAYENLIYNDIVQIDVNENFYNLTRKSIYMLYWYTKYCSKARFLLKTDDDIFLHISNLKQTFTSTPRDNNSILCHKNKSRRIMRNLNYVSLLKRNNKYKYYSGNRSNLEIIKDIKEKFSKYIISFKQLPGNLYPPYCSGFSYAMPLKVAQKLLNAAKETPFFELEDVFITAFCRHKTNITIVDHEHFTLKPYIYPVESKCAFDTGRITSNELRSEDVKQMWFHLNTQGYYCKINKN